MELIEVNENQKADYNRFVANSDSGSFLQSWEWGQWQESLGREAHRFIIKDNDKNNDEIAGAMQLIKMPLPGKKSYLYAPYGPVIDFRFKILDLRFLKQEIQKKFPKAVFVRLESKTQLPGLPSIAKKSLHIQPVNTLALDLTKSVDELLAGMHHKTRYNIRLAQKRGVEIVSDLVVVPGHGLYWKETFDLIVETSRRQEYKSFTFDYYQKLLDFFACNQDGEVKVTVYRALYQKQLLATAVMVDFGSTRTYLFGGSSSEHREVMAPHLLHYKAIEDAKKSGMKIYDFWGLETTKEKNPGFARFKLGFGGKKFDYFGAWDIICKSAQYKLYQAGRVLNRWKSKLAS